MEIEQNFPHLATAHFNYRVDAARIAEKQNRMHKLVTSSHIGKPKQRKKPIPVSINNTVFSQPASSQPSAPTPEKSAELYQQLLQIREKVFN